MQELRNFFFQTHLVRVVVTDGEPRFVASDLARVLGYRDANSVVRNVDTDERGTSPVSTPGGMQEMSVVTESGLYSAVLSSRRKEAREFKKWITSEVLPSIRKTGSYGVQAPVFQIPKTLHEALALAATIEQERATLACKVVEQAEDLAVLEPKAAFADRVADAEGAHTIADAAKMLGTGQNRLFDMLRRWGFLIPGTTKPYQTYLDGGLFKVVERCFEDRHGIDRLDCKTLITGKGMVAVQKKMQAEGRPSLMRPQHMGHGASL